MQPTPDNLTGTNGLIAEQRSPDHNGCLLHHDADASGSEDGDVTEDVAGDADGEMMPGCGYRRCQPSWLQRFNTPPWLLVAACCFGFMEGFVIFGVINVNTTSLERRFSLSSWRVAWITSSEDLAAGFITILLGYWGTFTPHKGRIVAVGAFVFGMGSLVMALPHALTGRYQLGTLVSRTCKNGEADPGSTCTSTSTNAGSDDSAMLFVFIAGQMLHAVGAASFYTLAVPWLDENIKTKNSPLYIGILIATSAVGTAVGFVIGGLCLERIYVDVGRVNPVDIDITPLDPRWVGAWWICFLVSCAACIFVALLLGCFPALLPAGKKNRAGRKSQAYKGKGDRETAENNFGHSKRDFLFSLKILLSNPTFMAVTLAGTVDAMGVVAFSTFMPKIIQFQFAMSAGSAAQVTGLILVPAAVLGQIIGGVIPKLLSLQLRGLLILGITGSALSGCFTVIFLVKCDMPQIAGVTVPYGNSTAPWSLARLDDACHMGCDCDTYSYEPVCGANDVTYFSPCHAGCDNSSESTQAKTYSSCSCVSGVVGNTSTGGAIDSERSYYAEAGVCSVECGVRISFYICFFAAVFFTFVSNNAGWAVTLRCVPEKERTFALGLQQTIGRFLGNVPGPLMFGTLFDVSCLVWQESCGGKGACWIYDNRGLSESLFAAAFSVKAISTFFLSLALIFYRPPDTVKEEITMVINTDSESGIPCELSASERDNASGHITSRQNDHAK